MSSPPVTRLLHADVAVGDELSDLAYPVTATTVVLGALATRDWRPMHHDKDFAVHRNGTRDIFLNTPNQAAWFERFVTDWTGPYGRLQRASRDPLGRDSQPKQRLHLVDCLIGLRMRRKRRHELAHQRYGYGLGHRTSPIAGGLSKHMRVI